jgi:hypothetical protein
MPQLRGNEPILGLNNWIQRYVFTNLHKIFFVDFPNILAEWIQILVEQNRIFHTVFLKNWTPELIHQVSTISNRVSHTFYFLLDIILEVTLLILI